MQKIIEKNFLILVSITIIVLGTTFWTQNSETQVTCNATDAEANAGNIPLANNGAGGSDQNNQNATGAPTLELEIKNNSYANEIKDIKDYLNKNGKVDSVEKNDCNAQIEARVNSKDIKKIGKELENKGESLKNTLDNSGVSNSLDNLKESIKNNEDLLKETEKDIKSAKIADKENLQKRQTSLETIIKQQQAQQVQIKETNDETQITVSIVRNADTTTSFIDAVKSKASNLLSSLVATMLIVIPIYAIYLGLAIFIKKGTTKGE
jgi:uncharacterized membrane protein